MDSQNIYIATTFMNVCLFLCMVIDNIFIYKNKYSLKVNFNYVERLTLWVNHLQSWLLVKIPMIIRKAHTKIVIIFIHVLQYVEFYYSIVVIFLLQMINRVKKSVV